MEDGKREGFEADGPFRHFEYLTKRLLSMPEREADAKEAERKQRKGSKPC